MSSISQIGSGRGAGVVGRANDHNSNSDLLVTMYYSHMHACIIIYITLVK